MARITIVDYGMGNLKSVAKAIEKVGHEACVTSELGLVKTADRLILPGVGAFRDAIGRLRTVGLVDAIHDFIATDRPFLGICLGLQLLFDTSYEDGQFACLGVLKGDVVRFRPTSHENDPPLKVPHMGWNQLVVRRPAPILAGLPADPSVYFVHSYYVRPTDPSITCCETEYGERFTSMVWRDNVLATQFHPEKSQRIGLAMLKNFAAL